MLSNQPIKKRTSLVPTWMGKKKKCKNSSKNDNPQLSNNVPEIKDEIEVEEDEYNSSNKIYPNVEIINNAQPYEKVTYKNTTTRSIERVETDGTYTNATETKENIEERIKYSNYRKTPQYKKTPHYDEVIDVTPKKNIHTDANTNTNPKINSNTNTKSIDSINNDSNYSNYKNSLKMVLQNGLLIKDLDKDEQTEEICLAAVSQNGLSLKYIREQTPKICLKAIKNNPLAFTYVRDKNQQICNEAVKINGLTLQFIKNQNPTLCINAVKQNPFALEYVINQTNDICEAALFRSGLALEYVQDKTTSLCLLALQQNSLSIKHIPLSLISGEIDFSDYVFVCVSSRAIVSPTPRIKGLKQIILPYNDNNFCFLNALMYNSNPVNYVLEKEGYIDDEFINNLISNNHYVLVV